MNSQGQYSEMVGIEIFTQTLNFKTEILITSNNSMY